MVWHLQTAVCQFLSPVWIFLFEPRLGWSGMSQSLDCVKDTVGYEKNLLYLHLQRGACRATIQQGLVVPLQLILLLCATCTAASNIF